MTTRRVPTKQRHPRIRHGKLHAYNNFIDGWGDYGMGCSTNSECYSERNVFQAGTNFKAIITRVGEDDGQGEVESHGDLLLNGAIAEERGWTRQLCEPAPSAPAARSLPRRDQPRE